MDSKSRTYNDSNSSTPKRRRLGTHRVLRIRNENALSNNNIPNKFSQIINKTSDSNSNSPQRCDSPQLPCNQVEYLTESYNNSLSDIPCSPCVFESSLVRDAEKWQSLIVSSNKITKLCNKNASRISEISENNDVFEDMFSSKLEQSSQVNHAINQSLLDKHYKENIEESFDIVNQTICQGNVTKHNKSCLFESKDSFLLDIRESGLIIEEKCRSKVFLGPKIVNNYKEGFYGLPIIAKNLFKTYRNIEKFYDWQEECLNLDAIRNRRNLIYALPTSGGKTLVAEVLMMREVLVRKKNALFILPFVAIVQEKIWSLSPFAVQLDYLVEEYAAGKGHIPPKKRRRKNSIYIATIEKGLALVRSLIEFSRLDEIGLIVVDELHLVGEKGRGGSLEMLLSTVIFANPNIQIVGMSATIGNLPELATFLRAEVFQREFRPVELAEYVKIGEQLYRMRWLGDQVELEPCVAKWECSDEVRRIDPDGLAGLVWGATLEGVNVETDSGATMEGGCLVFCPTKRNCENVAALLCKLQPKAASSRQLSERVALENAMRAEGASAALCGAVRCGVGVHHAGLAGDERAIIEHAFRSGIISVLCCTSTLAAGVNLPAQRVVIRAPRVARDLMSLAGYRQMVGRAGRAGHCSVGESVLICNSTDWISIRGILSSGVSAAASQLTPSALLVSGVALNLAKNKGQLQKLLGHTLLANRESAPIDIDAVCGEALRELFKSGALVLQDKGNIKSDCINDDDDLAVSKLGQAAIQGCMELSTAKQLLNDLEIASRALVLMGSLHLLYIVTPHDAGGVRPDYRHYYSLYCNLDVEGVQTAKILGITEMNAIRMMTGKRITNVSEMVIRRFYVALMLHDLWKQVPLPVVAEKYLVPRGTVQSIMTSASSLSSAASRVCAALSPLWTFAALLGELARRLQYCAAPELEAFMDLPNVKRARALQLVRAGYKRVEDLAKANVQDLTANVTHLSRTAADHLISAARMMLIEKVENLRAEAEDVMEGLNI